jgi:penicillin-binding protein 1A
MLKKIFWIGFSLFVLALAGGSVYGVWEYMRITRDLPKLTSIADYRPPAVSKVFSNDGTLIAEFYEQRRYPVKIAEIPKLVTNAFLAAEDVNFYQHQGIDYTSILRAIYKNLQAGSARQGASTITQQVVKNMLLTSERKLERKVKEAILSYRLERRFSKDEILEIYLNQIFFGNNAYGIKAAAQIYFHKQLNEITLAEAAILAGLPKAPSQYSPIRSMAAAKGRQKYVLGQMLKAGFATKDEVDAALKEDVKAYPFNPNNIFHSPYFVTEVRRILSEDPRWKGLDIDHDGFEIHTTLDLNADEMAENALQKGLREVDKRRGWRGPKMNIPGGDKKIFLQHFPDSADLEEPRPGQLYPALVTEIIRDKSIARVDLGKISSAIDYKNIEWARKKLDGEDRAMWITADQMLKVGDVIEVSLIENAAKDKNADKDKKDFILPGIEKQFKIDQTPTINGAVVLLDPYSGKVATIQGGYDFTVSKFNRATQGMRQPGSTFKPVIYFSAIDGFKYTPATIVYDEPRTFRVGNDYWTPGNFDGKFLGPITLRTALEKSRNLISAEIIAGIGIDPVIKYARKLGITSPLGRNLSLSLGSSEVTLLEMTRAYGTFAAKGVLFDSSFIDRIVDRDGKEIYNYDNEKLNKAQQVINENSAFVMVNMMKGVIENGTGYKVKEINRPVAGKTGTSNDQMDAWFIGYTPQWSCGVWVGFDDKIKIGEKETGGVVAAPIWLYFMRDFLNFQDKTALEKLESEGKAEAERLGIEYVPPQPFEPLDFSVPPGVDGFWVDKNSGMAAEANAPGAIYEYFVKGTEPNKTAIQGQDGATSYLESGDL